MKIDKYTKLEAGMMLKCQNEFYKIKEVYIEDDIERVTVKWVDSPHSFYIGSDHQKNDLIKYGCELIDIKQDGQDG